MMSLQHLQAHMALADPVFLSEGFDSICVELPVNPPPTQHQCYLPMIFNIVMSLKRAKKPPATLVFIMHDMDQKPDCFDTAFAEKNNHIMSN